MKFLSWIDWRQRNFVQLIVKEIEYQLSFHVLKLYECVLRVERNGAQCVLNNCVPELTINTLTKWKPLNSSDH